ncbi:MAG: hypothetical protein Q9207_004797 [Kuettlingeria erythrocarpa]
MAESVAGDIPTYAGVTKEHKFKLEDFGTRYIQSLLNPISPTLGTKIRTAWLEYEEGKTAEARFIRDMDKLECMIQAYEYERRTFGEKDLEEFQGLSSKISSATGKAWLKLLQQERQTHFSKRKRRNPVIFFIGAPGIGKKTQCALLCQRFGFQHISLDDLLHERSDDPTYPHAEFVKDCLEEKVDVPRDLTISLLERKINEGIEAGKKWSLVHGFPECIQDLLDFEEKAQRTNYTLLLNCSAEGLLQRVGREAGDELDIAKSIQDFQVRNAEVENHLKAAEGYFKEAYEDVDVLGHREILAAVQTTGLYPRSSKPFLPVTPRRTKRDEAQLTSLVRALLEVSGGRVDRQQHRFAEEYTASENANLYASIFDIARTYQFSDFDLEKMCNTLSKSPVSSRMTISVQDLEEWTMEMTDLLFLGFREGHLNLPSQVLSGFGFGQVDRFDAYLAHTSLGNPALSKPENNVPLLLAWSSTVSGRQSEVLSEWASSAEGWNLYKHLAEDFQGPQSVEQLALIMAALMNYRRLLPDLSDHSDQPIKGSYLADLDALLRGDSLGNSGRILEQMVVALVQVVSSFVDQFKDLVTFLETALGQKPPLSLVFDGFSHQYLRRRIDGNPNRPHKTAIAGLLCIKMPELRADEDADWVNVTLPEELSFQGSTFRTIHKGHLATDRITDEHMTPSHVVAVSSGDEGYLSPPPGLRSDQYALIRLSKVEDTNVLETLDTKIGPVNEVPNIEELGDESWEICILKSHRLTVQDTLRKIFSGSDVDLHYDPLEPTANDLEFWDYDTAKKLRQSWFFQRATRVVKMGWPAAAACYADLLEVMCGLRSKLPLVPAYRGRLQSKEDAVYIIEACPRGKLVRSCRGPQDGEATITGNVSVWEANFTGIDRRRNGMEWTVWEGDGCEVSEAIDGSGLLKKTSSIPACGKTHHVVSYFDSATEHDAEA